MKISVIGMGKIGLPLAVQFASKGHQVYGVDVMPRVIDQINAGVEPFPGEAELDVRLPEVVKAGLLTATLDGVAAVADSDAVVVVVPVVVDEEAVPDFRAMDAATQTIAAGLKEAAAEGRTGILLSYETTLPVHTTRERFLPALEAASGLNAGRDFLLCHSPERVYTGRIFADLRKYPKLVGGIDADSAAAAVRFYEETLDFDERPDLKRGNGVWDLGSAEAAELAKLAETTYRDVNIGLANQFARFADRTGIDIFQVIEASNSQPFSHIHQPGPAVGGHCIPVYPRFYLFNDPDATIVRAARESNLAQPVYLVGLLEGLLGGGLAGRKVLVLGAAYRGGGVKETAFSGVYGLVSALAANGAEPYVSDPLYTAEELGALGLPAYEPGTEVEGVIVHTEHKQYWELSADEFPGVRVLVDGRNVTDPAKWDGVVRKVLGVA
ncbi:nucleotide sugar dehydrogenase [Catenulispora yoronensis]|uniref:Nucleotide sugar dehydrogenase n=1 Tax=Catenulispora yoronensis TaxID=450799 RepID=A0ABN2V917_9ACTN